MCLISSICSVNLTWSGSTCHLQDVLLFIFLPVWSASGLLLPSVTDALTPLAGVFQARRLLLAAAAVFDFKSWFAPHRWCKAFYRRPLRLHALGRHDRSNAAGTGPLTCTFTALDWPSLVILFAIVRFGPTLEVWEIPDMLNPYCTFAENGFWLDSVEQQLAFPAVLFVLPLNSKAAGLKCQAAVHWNHNTMQLFAWFLHCREAEHLKKKKTGKLYKPFYFYFITTQIWVLFMLNVLGMTTKEPWSVLLCFSVDS